MAFICSCVSRFDRCHLYVLMKLQIPALLRARNCAEIYRLARPLIAPQVFPGFRRLHRVPPFTRSEGLIRHSIPRLFDTPAGVRHKCLKRASRPDNEAGWSGGGYFVPGKAIGPGLWGRGREARTACSPHKSPDLNHGILRETPPSASSIPATRGYRKAGQLTIELRLLHARFSGTPRSGCCWCRHRCWPHPRYSRFW